MPWQGLKGMLNLYLYVIIDFAGKQLASIWSSVNPLLLLPLKNQKTTISHSHIILVFTSPEDVLIINKYIFIYQKHTKASWYGFSITKEG